MAEVNSNEDETDYTVALPAPGLKVISCTRAIPIVSEAVEQTKNLHQSLREKGGILGKAYNLWFDATCKSLDITAKALAATIDLEAAQKRVWANWITIDEVLAAKLGIDLPANKRPRKVFIGLSNDQHHVCNCSTTDSGLLQICKCQKLELKKLDDSKSFSLGQSKSFPQSNSGDSLSPTYSTMSSSDEDPVTVSSSSDDSSNFDNPEASRLALSAYLSLNKIDINEDLLLENKYGLLDDILELYSNLGNDINI